MHDRSPKPAVFLDRDDTLIRCNGLAPGNDLGDPALVEPLPGAVEACRRLKDAGFLLVVITNQGGVARGRYSEQDVERVHERINTVFEGVFGAFRACPYHPKGTVPKYAREHPWRKPSPGMILDAAQELNIDLARSWTVGDKERDAAAGRTARMRHHPHQRPRPRPRPRWWWRNPRNRPALGGPLRPGPLRGGGHHPLPYRPSPEPVTEQTTITLRALDGAPSPPLSDPTVRRTVLSAATALAERNGVKILTLDATNDALTTTLEAPRLVAIGFAAELRRITTAWYRHRTGIDHLWGEPRSDEDDPPDDWLLPDNPPPESQ